MSSKKLSAVLLVAVFLAGLQAGIVYSDHAGLSPVDGEEEPDVIKEEVRSYEVNGSLSEVRSEVFQNSRESVVSINHATAEGFVEETAVGSGFVYDREGHIITNNHVVAGGEVFDVTFLDDEVYEAEIVGNDPYTDLAVLKVDDAERDFEPLRLGDSTELMVGEDALAIGNPFGLEGSMTSGIISHTNRMIPAVEQFSIPNVIQTDAPINPGNSGGPLLNIKGEVIGVNTAINTQDSTFSGVGFAVPVSTVERVVPELISTGTYEHPWLGVSGMDVTPDIAEEMDLEESRGFLVVEVVEDSPADMAGVQAGEREEEIRGSEIILGGDVIVGIEDEEITQLNEVLNYLSEKTEVGDTITLTVIRDGEEKTLDLTLEGRPDPGS